MVGVDSGVGEVVMCSNGGTEEPIDCTPQSQTVGVF